MLELMWFERIADIEERPHDRLLRTQYRRFDMTDIPSYHVLLHFGSGIPSDAQGVAMLALEKHLRELTACPCEVFKETMGDDSKLRRAMTAEQREKL
jgi:hypothetical protein